MTPRKRKSRIYWRTFAGGRRAWADFRDYGDVGGRVEPLVAEGERFATADPDIAAHLVARRRAARQAAPRRRRITPPRGRARGGQAAPRIHRPE